MPKNLIDHIIQDFKALGGNVLLVENNDGFLLRPDISNELANHGVKVCSGNQIEHRIAYELRNPEELTLLVSKSAVVCLEDIERSGKRQEFFIDRYIKGYHIQSVINESLDVLHQLHREEQIISLNKSQTESYISQLKQNDKVEDKLDEKHLLELIASIEKKIDKKSTSINWTEVSLLIGSLVKDTIGSGLYNKTLSLIETVNFKFQEFRDLRYNASKTSSSIKRPQNVCKILDYIRFNFGKEKIALIIVDGMSIWQYMLLKDCIPGLKKEDITLSWIPSITQLSRQAIFRGGIPNYDYQQGPRNEKKLWFEYWENKSVPSYQIDYMHSNIDLKNSSNISKLAIVFKELDGKMHGNCDDYKDLKSLTENWIERSKIVDTIEYLLSKKFKVFITTDHGNVEAIGWRGLKSREKLGQKHKSGSKGQRHLEYSEKWLFDEFVENNESILDSVVQEDNSIYFKNNQSFSNKEKLVTHGGAHFLEVVIPFIEVSNE